MSLPLHSAIYHGQVTHQRFLPIHHKFDYQLFMLYLDLDELDKVFTGSWLWSTERKNIAYLRREDHLGDPQQSIKAAICDLVYRRLGLSLKGPIRLLTHLRYWGYCFNPVSFYFCYTPSGQDLEVIVAEINNTPWGEQYCYVLSPHGQTHADAAVIETKQGSHPLSPRRYHFEFKKNFHISPLMDMDMSYDWWFTAPEETLTIHMNNTKDQQKWFTAHLALKRQPINRSNLARVLMQYPCMTATVIRAIYWQALRTWLKGAKFYSHP